MPRCWEWGTVRKHQKLFPHRTELVPARSKTDPPLNKTKPISDVGSASVITDLRNGKKCCAAAGREKSGKQCEKQPCRHKVSEEGGGGGAPGTGADSPAAHDENYGDTGCHPTIRGGP